MKPARGSTIWAGLTLVAGFLLVNFFLRKPSPPDSFSSAKDTTSEADTSSLFGSKLTEVAVSDQSSASISMASQPGGFPQLPLAELTYSSQNIALPEWVRPSSRLDALIEEESSAAASSHQPMELQEIPTWLPDATSSEGRSAASSWLAGDGETIASIDAEPQVPKWPDESLGKQPVHRPEGSVASNAGLSTVSHREATLNGNRSWENPIVGSELRLPSIRAGPAVRFQQRPEGPAVGEQYGSLTAQQEACPINATPVSDQMTPSKWRNNVADRKRRFVYQPGYRPDD